MSKNTKPFSPKIHRKVRELFPFMPILDCGIIISKISLYENTPSFLSDSYGYIKANVAAHIRHTKTNYDILLETVSREEARRSVSKTVSSILRQWSGKEYIF